MRKKTVKSNYRPPNRSEVILGVVGLLVVISLLFSAIAPSFMNQVVPPTLPPPVTFITVVVSTPTTTPTPTPSAGTLATSTPGQAPPPVATP